MIESAGTLFNNVRDLPAADQALVVTLLFSMLLCGWAIRHLLRWGIMPNPTSRELLLAVDRLLMSAGIDPRKRRMIDCGSGFGYTLLVWQELGYNRPVGIEGSRLVWLVAKGLLQLKAIAIGLFKKSSKPLLKCHLLCQDWRKAWPMIAESGDLLFFYINQKAMADLALFLLENPPEQELWIVSHTFALPSYFPVKTTVHKGLYHTPIYLYRFAAKLNPKLEGKLAQSSLLPRASSAGDQTPQLRRSMAPVMQGFPQSVRR